MRLRIGAIDDHAINYDERFSRHIIIIRDHENQHDDLVSLYSDGSRPTSVDTCVSETQAPARERPFPNMTGPITFSKLAAGLANDTGNLEKESIFNLDTVS